MNNFISTCTRSNRGTGTTYIQYAHQSMMRDKEKRPCISYMRVEGKNIVNLSTLMGLSYSMVTLFLNSEVFLVNYTQ